VAVPVTFLLVLIGWVFFRSETLPEAFTFLGSMLGLGTVPTAEAGSDPLMGAHAWVALSVGALLSLAPLIERHEIIKDWPITGCSKWDHVRVTWRFALSIVLLVCSLFCLIAGQFNPFIYFRF